MTGQENFPSPADDLDEAAEESSVLFGAPEAGRFRPLPKVEIDGAFYATGVPDVLEGRRVILEGLSVTWGRDEVLDQPTPATGTLSMFDASGSWATSRDLRGRLVNLFWNGTDPTGSGVNRAFFRGRVGAPVRVSRKTVIGPSGERIEGALIELPLVSRLVDLANMIPAGAWPAETMAERVTRVAAAHAGVLVGGLDVRDFWEVPGVAPVAAEDQVSRYEHLMSLFDSSGADRMTYLPHDRKATYVQRRDYFSSRGLAQLWWHTTGETGHARAGKGVFARATTDGRFLDAQTLEYPDESGITQPQKITTVRLRHRDLGSTPDPYAERVVELTVDGTDPETDGVRTVQLDSIVSWNSYADVAASDLEEVTQKEAAEWRLDEPLVWRTRYTDGFESFYQAEDVLVGAEEQSPFFLQRSYLPRYGIRPVVGVMGGRIGYVDGGWEVEMRTAPVTTTLPQHPISWSEIDDGSIGLEVRWYDDDHERGLHESLTYEDMGWVSRGLGVATEGPDTGWDFLP